MKPTYKRSVVFGYAMLWVAALLALGPSCGVRAVASNGNDIQFDFEGTGPLQGWRPTDTKAVRLVPGYNGTQSLQIDRPNGGPGRTSADFELALDQLRGARIQVDAMARADAVSQPPHSYNGVKAMLHLAGPDGENWPQQSNVFGTFDWKPLHFVTTVPADATRATLILGLEEVSGRVTFDDVRITVLARQRVRPAQPLTGPFYTGHAVPRLRGVMINPKMGPDDLRTLGQWGANHIRWQLMWNGFPHSPADDADAAAYDTWLEGALDHLDEMLPLCQREGIQVLIDLHTPPGGRSPGGDCRIFSKQRFQDHFLEVWDKIARRYQGNPQVWGYDLCNEPVLGDVPAGLMRWRDLANAAAHRVRAIDSEHAIVVEPDLGGAPEGLNYLEPIPVPGVVYSTHMYAPHLFTHQGVHGAPLGVHYPGTIDGVLWDKDRLRLALKPAIDYAHDYHVQMYIGEFSAIRWAPGDDAEHYLRDCIDIFEENGWDWAYHAFREWNGWSVEHGSDPSDTAPAKQPTGRELLLRSWFARNAAPAAGQLQQSELPLEVTQTAAITPPMPAPANPYRILFVGNSITRHGANADTIARLKWDHVAGMAASGESKDYVHLLTASIQAALPGRTVIIRTVSLVPGGRGTAQERIAPVQAALGFAPDLVVVQHGEHEIPAGGAFAVRETYVALLSLFETLPQRPRLVAIGNWALNLAPDKSDYSGWPATVEHTMQDVCRERHIPFVAVDQIAADPLCHGSGQDPGVQWHPDDLGHQRYAETIYATLKPMLPAGH